MASRHFSIKHGKVGSGKKHALYIAGQGSYSERDDVVSMIDVNMPSWARDGADFFDAADKMERANGRTYTEFEFAIPRGITDPVAYAREFASKILGGNHPYRLAVHDKLASDGVQNTHGHLMFTERKLDGFEREIDHFFLRANTKNPENGGTAKDRKWNAKDMVETMRQEYSLFAKSYGVELDLRSNLAQGLSEPEPKIGPVHDRSEQSKNRSNLISKVESLRDERLAKTGINQLELKQKYESQQKAKERRKELWTSFHKQRRSNYSRLADEFKVSHVHQKEKLTLIKSAYFDKRQAIKNDHSIKYIERRAAISIANMERITKELAIKAEFETIRQAIKTEQNEHYFEKYCVYLDSQAQLGDEVAQAELKRMIANKRRAPEEQNSIVAIGLISKHDPAQFSLKYEVSRGGEVTYKLNGHDVIKDIGKRVDLFQTDELSIETGLRLAQAKFGNKLTLTGTQEFQERAARVAAEKGLKVEFVDPYLNNIMQTYSETLLMQQYLKNAEKNLIDSGIKLKSIQLIDRKSQIDIKDNIANLDVARFYLELKENESKNSLSEAIRVAIEKGFEVINPSNSKYRGSILKVTSHHILQTIGRNRVVIHERNKVDESTNLKEGLYAEFNYQAKTRKASIVSMANPKSRTR